MSDGIRRFNRELYLEHFDEVSFLYKVRESYLGSDELAWHELQDDEDRIEAHLEALVAGGQYAIDSILEFCEEGDSAAFNVMACLFCRRDELRGLFEFLATLATEDAEILNAVKDGLIQDWPDHWFSSLVDYPFYDFPFLTSIFIPLYANRRRQIDLSLYANVVHQTLFEQRLFLKSVRRLGGSQVLSRNHWALSEEDSQDTLMEKALCLHQLTNSYRELDYFRKCLPEKKIPFAAIIVAADERLARYICQPCGNPSLARVIAMGLSGLWECVEQLLAYLQDESIAPIAAIALQTITGAGLKGERFIEDEWSEDELFADELKAFRDGQLPQHPDGGPYGSHDVVLSTHPEVWRQWLRKHSGDFQPGIRYRMGYPVSPCTLVYTLSHPLSTWLIRYLTYEELVIRYGATIAFNPEDWVIKQKKVISELSLWAKTVEQNFQPGCWHLCQQPIELPVAQAPSHGGVECYS